MFGSKNRARIAELEDENDELVADKKALQKEIAQTGVLLQSARDARDIAGRQNVHLKAENNKLGAELDAANAKIERMTGGLRNHKPKANGIQPATA